MTDAITKQQYDEKRDAMARQLRDECRDAVDDDEFDSVRRCVLETASDDITYDQWFARDYYGASLYGSIIEHGEADPSQYSDWEGMMEASTPEKAIERLAYCVFEADVIDRALAMDG